MNEELLVAVVEDDPSELAFLCREFLRHGVLVLPYADARELVWGTRARDYNNLPRPRFVTMDAEVLERMSGRTRENWRELPRLWELGFLPEQVIAASSSAALNCELVERGAGQRIFPEADPKAYGVELRKSEAVRLVLECFGIEYAPLKSASVQR